MTAPAAGTDVRWLAPLKTGLLLAGLALIGAWALEAHPPVSGAARAWLLAAGLVPALGAMLLYALRFRAVLRVAQVDLDVVTTLRMQLLALFFHCFVPLSAGADLTRFARLRALLPERSRGAVAGAIVLDHFVGLGALVALALVLWTTLVPVEIPFRHGFAGFAALAMLVVIGVSVVRWQRGRAFELRALARRIAVGRRELAAAFAFSLVMQALLATAVLLGAAALAIEVSYLEVLFVLAGSLVFQAVPLNVAGAGAAELAGAGLYVALGVPLPAAVLLVSVLYFYRLALALLGGAWELAVDRARSVVVEHPAVRQARP